MYWSVLEKGCCGADPASPPASCSLGKDDVRWLAVAGPGDGGGDRPGSFPLSPLGCPARRAR